VHGELGFCSNAEGAAAVISVQEDAVGFSEDLL
jgi:hypothetical protein